MDARGKRLLIIATTVAVLFLGIAAYFIFFNKKVSQTQSVNVTNSLFPFDQKSIQVNQLPVSGGTNQTPVGELVANPITINSRIRLRKITSFPVSGFVAFTTTTMKTDTVIDPKTKKDKMITTPIIINHVRYNDQRTGNIFDGIIDDESILNTKITKTILPAAEELIFDSTGTIGFLRYEKDNAIKTFKLIIPPPPTVPQYCQYLVTTDLKVGSKGAGVKMLQSYINNKLTLKTILDGSFGKKTKGYVMQIQKLFSVPATGVTDDTTRTAMNIECAAAQKAVSDAQNSPLELKGSLVDGTIQQMVKNDLDNTLFFLQKNGQKIQGVLGSFTGGAGIDIFDSSFNEWLPQFINKNLITMTTYASGQVDGYMYGLDPQNKTFGKLLGPLTGLTTLTSPDGTQTLISDTENNQLVTKVITLATGAQKILPFTTLPEKCSWYSNDQLFCGVPTTFTNALYPDDWYKGTISFSDSLWQYTLSTGRAIQVVVPTDSIDMFRMESYSNMGYIFFMNKNNYELWSYRVGGND